MPKITLKKIPVKKLPKRSLPFTDEPPFFLPSFGVSAKQMPEIKDWDVGKKYRIVIEVEQKSKEERNDHVHASFDIVAYKHLRKKSIDEMTDKEFGIHQGKVLSKA